MNFSEFLLSRFLCREFKQNLKFKDIHKGETCYIIGNGVSLKSMSLDRFSDKVSIGSNSLFFHKDFKKLDCKYYQIPPSFFFLPYRRFYGKFQKNYLSGLYRKKINSYTGTHFFTSIYNRFSMRANNVSYEHHFGKKDWDKNYLELDGAFSCMSGATRAMIGTAIYMGFEKAIMVGVDYTFSPSLNHHFYDKGCGVQKTGQLYDELFFKSIQEKIDLLTITLDGYKSEMLNYKTYYEYTGDNENYKENTELVDVEILDHLHKQGFYKIY